MDYDLQRALEGFLRALTKLVDKATEKLNEHP